jgi:uncharacterized protein YkwD
MRIRGRIGLKPLFVMTAMMIGAQADLALANAFSVDQASIGQSILSETNSFRRSNGVSNLAASSKVRAVAQSYAEFLARNNASGHEADGRTPGQRLAAAGMTNCTLAENVYEYWSQPNIAPWQTVASAAMNFWKGSPGHNANLRKADMTLLGVGSAGWTHEGRNYYKIVQLFTNNCGVDQPAASSELWYLKARHSGKCLHQHGGTHADGAPITQWDCVNQPNVKLRRIDHGDGTSFLQFAHSNKCVHLHGASTADGAAITQWSCIHQPNVKWRIEPAGGGHVFVRSASSGKCVHQHGGTYGNGDRITQWACINQPNVQWQLVRAPQ